MDSLLKRIYRKLYEYPFFAQVFTVLKKTPAYVLHWYLLLVFCLTLVIISVILALVSFESITTKTQGGFSNTAKPTTIQRDELKNALDTYEAKQIEFDRLKLTPPSIVDPGR